MWMGYDDVSVFTNFNFLFFFRNIDECSYRKIQRW